MNLIVLLNIATFARQENWLLVSVTSVLLALILWMLLEGIALLVRLRREARGGEANS